MSVIFISHTHADKPLVEPIALKLAAVAGHESIFYDSWSIQPGDGIINKMNDALMRCKFFFFFVSKKSLTSKMVELEWQNAIIKATKGEAKLIPIRLDDCTMPPLLLQTLYIDLYSYGPDVALRQMVDVIQGRNTFRPGETAEFQNVRGYISKIEGGFRVEVRAEVYMEPHSRYIVLVENKEEEITWTAESEGMFNSGFNTNLTLNNGHTYNGISIGRLSPTSPGFPFIIRITSKGQSEVKIDGAMRAISNNQFVGFPLIHV